MVSAGGAAQDDWVYFSRDQLAFTQLAHHFAVFHYYLPPQERRHRPTGHIPSFPRTVVAHVEVLARQFLLERWINQAQVGVAAGGDHTFTRVQPKDTRGIGGRYVSETLQRHTSLDYPFGVNDAEPRLGPEVAPSNIIDMTASEFDFQGSRIFVSRGGRQAVTNQAFPQGAVVVGIFERGIGVIAEAARLAIVLGVKTCVMVQSFGVNG